jgi:hypothetical protein
MPKVTFNGSAHALPPELCARMRGVSWRPDPRCPALAALAVLAIDHWDFGGAVKTGQLVVAGSVADEVLAIFARLFALDFPIARMEPIDAFGADDDAAMAANNTSAFNFRNIAGTEILSQHALGVAIDLNPVQNPMIVGAAIHPPAGAAYTDRSVLRPGMITPAVVGVFRDHGWQWGGDWSHMKDYHHFAKPATA